VFFCLKPAEPNPDLAGFFPVRACGLFAIVSKAGGISHFVEFN